MHARLAVPLVLLALLAAPLGAQHQGHQAPPEPESADERPPAPPPVTDERHPPAHGTGHGDEMAMPGLLGDYGASRESSGTSWQPEASPAHMRHTMHGPWMVGGHILANAVYSDQGGPRGDDDVFVTSMAMAMGQREWAGGRLGLRGMISFDPWLVGRRGYPLLFQTGETPDGVNPLIDRQHPHDLLMEVAASYSRPFGPGRSWFVYAALPGEPALGPPTFMHRFSGAENPEAPLGHHWLDSTHIAFGVATGGVVWDRFKLDASAFNGREPDQDRTDVETRALDSEALRLTVNPSARWSLQASRGWLDAPEQLEPEVDVVRTTASVVYHRPLADGDWQTTLAWGENAKSPGSTTDAWLLDSALRWRHRHTVFVRGERVTNDELFREEEPLHGRPFDVVKVAAGYLHRFSHRHGLGWGLGFQAAQHFIPAALEGAYTSDPTSYLVFARIESH